MVRPYINEDPKATYTYKVCSKCGKLQSLLNFGFAIKARNIYRPECRPCRNIVLKDEHKQRKLLHAQRPFLNS
jgi:hypothetical protein